jgi:hypothetical protein
VTEEVGKNVVLSRSCSREIGAWDIAAVRAPEVGVVQISQHKFAYLTVFP